MQIQYHSQLKAQKTNPQKKRRMKTKVIPYHKLLLSIKNCVHSPQIFSGKHVREWFSLGYHTPANSKNQTPTKDHGKAFQNHYLGVPPQVRKQRVNESSHTHNNRYVERLYFTQSNSLPKDLGSRHYNEKIQNQKNGPITTYWPNWKMEKTLAGLLHRKMVQRFYITRLSICKFFTASELI